MAWEQHYRKRYTDYIREIIGDTQSVLFDEDELKSYVEKHMATTLTTINPTASNSRYRVACGCSCTGRPIYELTVTSGVADAVYVIDEAASVVIFDPLDPDNAAAAPTDGDTIEVTYYQICTSELISELFLVLSSSHAKLVSSQNIMGSQMDLKELADAFYDQAVRWKIEV